MQCHWDPFSTGRSEAVRVAGNELRWSRTQRSPLPMDSVVAALIVGIGIGFIMGMRSEGRRRGGAASTGSSTSDSIRRKSSRQLVDDNVVEMSTSKPVLSSLRESERASSSSLPPGWIEKISSTHGKTYYYNTTTGESAWETPTTT